MGEENIWRSPSMEGKWMNGKGDVLARRIDYYQKIRLTVEQLKEILPRLVEFVNEVEDELEQEERNRDE